MPFRPVHLGFSANVTGGGGGGGGGVDLHGGWTLAADADVDADAAPFAHIMITKY